MKPTLVNAGLLLTALEDSRTGRRWYFNKETGGSEVLPEEAGRPQGGYVTIEPLPSSSAWSMMRDFSDLLPAGEAKEDLTRATKSTHPFRRFKEALAGRPEVGDAWSAFRREARLQLVRVWLENHEIEAELRPEPSGQ